MHELSIRKANKAEIRQLGALWKACFPSDSSDYINAFLTALPQESVALVGWVGDEAATMLFLLPATAEFRADSYAVRYLYAGCTHPQHRGNGYYRELMQAAARLVESMGEHAIYLHPADETLDKTYRRLGYQDGIFGVRYETPQNVYKVPFCRTDYFRKRKQLLTDFKRNIVVWDPSEAVVSLFLSEADAMVINDHHMLATTHEAVTEWITADHYNKNKDFCLWLPVKRSPLQEYMAQYNGFSGIIGD